MLNMSKDLKKNMNKMGEQQIIRRKEYLEVKM